MLNLNGNDLKQVLLLHSYHKGLIGSDKISEGVEKVFSRNLEYELTTEYMDSKKIDTPEYFQALLTLYEKKFSSRKYEVVIVSDNYAYKFVLENYNKLFKNTPIVFCGVENFKEYEIPNSLKPLVTGVIEYKQIKRNIELITELIPTLDTLYIISDNSFSSKAIKKQILNATIAFKSKFRIIYDEMIDIHSLGKTINSLPKNSAVLYTSLYTDKHSKYIPYHKIKEFFKNSTVPIFTIDKVHLGAGVVGGLMVSLKEQGVEAAKIAFKIIEGEKAGDISITTPSSNYYFDYKALSKYNLDKSEIPFLSIVVNQPKMFFERNREIVDATFVLMPLLIFLLIGLIVNIARRVRLETKLQEQSRLDNVLLNNIKSSIYWESKDNILLGCNDAFCKLLNKKKKFIIGTKSQDLLPELYEIIPNFDKFIKDELDISAVFCNKTMNLFIRRKEYFDKNGKEAGLVTLISDITKLRVLELEKKKKEQFEIQRSKLAEIGEIITSIAHQWKAPLIEISTIAQELILKRKKRDVSFDETQKLMGEAMLQVDYMSNTINDFRNFVRPSFKKSDFNIKDAIQELLTVVEHNIKYNYIEIELEYEDDKDFIINGYPNEFKQSILGIINNAKDSILKKRENEDFEAKIKINVFKSKNSIFLNIKDNGMGINEENLNKVFEPFYTTKKNGDGFGLYMVKIIIEDKMDGKINAIYNDNGANFLICLKEGENENIIT